MGLLEFALVFSVVFALYNVQQIKMILKDKGHPVDMFSNLLQDYRQFKALIPKEPDEQSKMKYQKILNGLHFCLLGIVLFAIMVINNRM